MTEESVVDTEAHGEVRFYNPERGFGFCRRARASDVFVHASELKKAGILEGVQPGEWLKFDVVSIEGRGLQARKIERLKRD